MTTLYDFFADWCQPCKRMAPIIEEIEKEKTNIVVKKINVDKDQKTAQKYGVMSIPTYIVEKDDKVTGSIIGATTKAKILALL